MNRETTTYDYQVVKLNNKFFEEYPKDKFPELMQKDTRPYTCLLFQTHYDYYICVPFRSYIRHKNAYMFKKSKRSREKLSGIDYSKMVIIIRNEYISDEPATIDKDEYVETITHINKIQSESLKYLNNYIGHIVNNTINASQFKRDYQYTTLKYFHKELGI